jgi:hypothetical protein
VPGLAPPIPLDDLVVDEIENGEAEELQAVRSASEPYYQLIRQTLLAWQMVAHEEFDATDWLHIHVVPELNVAPRQSRGVPELVGATLADKWRSVLKQPER